MTRPVKKRRGAPPTHPPEMSERFMVRCSLADLERWRAEAARRGLARGRDTGVGALARIGLGVLCADAARPDDLCWTCGHPRDGHSYRHPFVSQSEGAASGVPEGQKP